MNTPITNAAGLLALAVASASPAQHAIATLNDRKPDAVVDLRTADGASVVKAQWRYHDAEIVTIDARGPGPDLQATGAPLRTFDIAPKAGAAEFDDTSWLFGDPNRNTIYRYTPGGGVAVFRSKSGYTGPDIASYRQPGSNGLTFDPDGRLTVNEHANRRVTRLEPNGVVTVLVDRLALFTLLGAP